MSVYRPYNNFRIYKSGRTYELLCLIDDICRKEGVTYFLDGGSLIGSVREKDLIAWDDDIDIKMRRDEYPKFKAAMEKNLPEYIRLIELAARGEEVRDAITDALSAMNGDINYIFYEEITVTSATSDSTVYTGGYKYEKAVEGIDENTFVEPCLADLTAYTGRYAAKSTNGKITLYFDRQPTNGTVVKVCCMNQAVAEGSDSSASVNSNNILLLGNASINNNVLEV